MILRRYGTTVHSVELNFDSKALNEIGFRRDRETSIDEAEFEAGWETVEEREMAPTSEGPVQDEADQALLDSMKAEIQAWLGELGEDEALLVLNGNDDYPKTRHKSKVVVERGENRLHFTGWVEPPLRMARVRKTG